MDDRLEEALKVVGFVALLLIWFRAAAALAVLSLDALPDPVAALVVPAWLLLPFLLLGGVLPAPALSGERVRDAVIRTENS